MAIMPPLSADPSLTELQAWVKDMKAANGWTPTDFRHELSNLVEEIGEMAKAHRKQRKGANITTDQQQVTDDLGEEMADVLIYLFSLANIEEINIAESFHRKMEKNRQREWKKVV